MTRVLCLALALAGCSSELGSTSGSDELPRPTWRTSSDGGPGDRDAATSVDGGPGDGGDVTGTDAGADPDAGSADCVTGTAPWSSFTVSASDTSRAVELPMDVGVTYRSITVEYEVTPGTWPEQCWNPASSRWMGPFQSLLEIRKGTRFCRGGNLLGLSSRAPPNLDLWAESYYADSIGSSCSGSEHAILGSHPAHGLEPGTAVPVRVHYDAEADTVDLDIGSRSWSGGADPDIDFVHRAGEALYLRFSLEDWYECYEPPGGDPDPACCHIPSLGWTYRDVTYELCR